MRVSTPVVLVCGLSLALAACGGGSEFVEEPATTPPGAQEQGPEADSVQIDTDADVDRDVDPDAGDADADGQVDEGDVADEDEAAAEPAVFAIADTPPEPRSEVAPGVVVAKEVGFESTQSWYVVLSASEDGSVVENWRFLVDQATAGNDPAHETAPLAPDTFSSDFTKIAGTAKFRLEPIGFDTQVGYFTPDGTFTNLSGRGEPEQGVSQSDPVFGPDDRLWFWQQAEGATYDLWSVALDGSDRRQENPGLAYPGQRFAFTQGGHPVPEYVETLPTVVADDGSLAVQEDYDGWRVDTDLSALAEAPQLISSEAQTAVPVAFLPGSTDQVLCGSATMFVCDLDLPAQTYTIGTELVPESEEWRGMVNGPRLLPDGTVAWTTHNSWTIDGTAVARFVWMDPTDSSLVGTAAIAHENPNSPYPWVIGHAE